MTLLKWLPFIAIVSTIILTGFTFNPQQKYECPCAQKSQMSEIYSTPGTIWNIQP